MPSKNLGLAYILLSVFFASLMVILIKHLSESMNIYTILFYRGFFGFIFVLIFFLKIDFNILYTKRIHIHLIRSIVNALALYFWFTSLTLSTLADVSAIGNSAPIFATLLAVLFMKEKIILSRMYAILFGFIGVIIILNPNFTDVNIGHYYALIAAILWGFLVVFLKNLTKTENAFSVIFYFQLFLFLSFGILFYDYIELPTNINFIYILLLALFGNLSQICYFQALKFKDITFISPFEYLRFLFLTIFGIIFFYEYPSIGTYIGSIIIFFGILILNYNFNFLQKK
jgi:drug/metabolite transporter (DMT)-like permease